MRSPHRPDSRTRQLPLAPGVMAIQLHPQHAALLAVGCYDGSVAVYDICAQHATAPLFRSSATSGGHSRPVWGVVWQAAEAGAPFAFHSLSSDGRVLLWTLAATELTCQVCFPSVSLGQPLVRQESVVSAKYRARAAAPTTTVKAKDAC